MAQRHNDNRRRAARGFSMLELTLILAAVSIMTAAAAPTVLRIVHQQRQDAAHEEMASLYRAIVGDDSAGVYGYVGDMGRMPYDLGELVEHGSQPFFTASPTSGLGAGWNGPYINEGRDAGDYGLDPWGSAYDIGVVGAGQLRSAGPNGVYDDADDLVYPPAPSVPYGTLIVVVRGHSEQLVIDDPDGCVVALGYSSSGLADAALDELAPFSFEDVHRGLHTIEVTCARFDGGTAAEQTIVAVRGAAAQQVAEVHVDLGGSPDDGAEASTDDSETTAMNDSIGAVTAPFTGQR